MMASLRSYERHAWLPQRSSRPAQSRMTDPEASQLLRCNGRNPSISIRGEVHGYLTLPRLTYAIPYSGHLILWQHVLNTYNWSKLIVSIRDHIELRLWTSPIEVSRVWIGQALCQFALPCNTAFVLGPSALKHSNSVMPSSLSVSHTHTKTDNPTCLSSSPLDVAQRSPA
jgi:hypothetical protein